MALEILLAGLMRQLRTVGDRWVGTGADAADPIPDTNPFSSDADIQQGQALFQTHCSYCHGASGEGGRGADLTAGIYRRGGRDPELYASVRFGVPGSEMGPVRATDDEVWKLVAFVKRIGSQGLLREGERRSVGGTTRLWKDRMRELPSDREGRRRHSDRN